MNNIFNKPMPPTRIVQYYSKFETGTSGTWLWMPAEFNRQK